MGNKLNSLCVFCGSNMGGRAEFRRAAEAMGELLARRGITLVYGGGKIGLMGVVADAVMAAGGRSIGVIPHALMSRELGHGGLTELIVVDSMHERKAKMAERSDGFIALPGGLGTFEELLEIMTWAQLGIHRKPCGVLNIEGFYDGLAGLIDHAIHERFIKPENRAIMLMEREPEALLARMEAYEAPPVDRWINRDET